MVSLDLDLDLALDLEVIITMTWGRKRQSNTFDSAALVITKQTKHLSRNVPTSIMDCFIDLAVSCFLFMGKIKIGSCSMSKL